MYKFVSKNSQFFFSDENFFLNHLFVSFNRWLRKTDHFRSLNGFRIGKIVVVIFFCCWQNGMSQQDPQFSQNMFNLVTVNPASAGSNDMFNVMAISRQQYLGLTGRPITTVFGADAVFNFFGVESGVGLNFMNDQIGFLENKIINLCYSYRLSLHKGILGIGLSGGIYNQTFDPTQKNSDGTTGFNLKEYSEVFDLDDELILESKVTGTTADFGVGVFFKNKDFYAGLSALHLFSPEPKFDGEYFTYVRKTFYLTGGYNYYVPDKSVVIQPSVFLKSDGVSIQGDVNVNIQFKKRYWGGMTYRYQSALVLLGGIELKSGLKIGYSYDIPVSYSSNLGGGHEIMIGYVFDLKIEKKTKGYKSVRYL